MKNINPLKELDTSPDSEFIKAVDFVVRTPVAHNIMKNRIMLGKTPLVLRLCADLDTVAVKTNYGTIEKVISEFVGRENNGKYDRIHNIDPEILKQIPVAINNPIAVIQSQTVATYSTKKPFKPNGLVILTELFETDKSTKQQKPMIVAIHITEITNRKQKEIRLHIPSIHGRTNEFIVDNLSSNLLMYLNCEKCRQLMINHFTSERLRSLHKDNHRNERLQIIAEMCGFKIHKGRFLNTDETTMEVQVLLQENDHLYETNHNAKQSGLQEKKRTIPTPTGYKTEEDLWRFRLDMVKQHFHQKIDTLPENEQRKILAYEKGVSEIWERLPEKERNALATNFYINATRDIDNGAKIPPAMSNAAAKNALENRRLEREQDNEPDIDDDMEIDR